MKLAEYQRALVTELFAADERAVDPELGARARVALYRAMVQRRMRNLTRLAYRSTHHLVGDDAFDACFARYLASTPPSTPYLRDAAHAFGAYACTDQAFLARGPTFLPGLLRFEACVWECAYRAEPEDTGPVRELDFARPPAFLRGASTLVLDHPVQRVRTAGERELPARVTTLWIFRTDSGDVRFAPTTRLIAEVHAGARATPARSLTELVTAGAHALARPLDQGLLEELTDGLSKSISLGVLRGSH